MKNILLPAFITLSFLACTSSPKPETSIRNPAFFERGSSLDAADILKSSSSQALKATKIRWITDNDASFDSKLAAIRSARRGETIRLSYYIYALDESSAVFYDELLKAADRGVRIKLLADFITNYKNLDLFSYLQEHSRGAIQVKLYGRPTSGILRDLSFMTMPCPETQGAVKSNTCSSYKWKQLKTVRPDFYSKLMASGLYAKNGTALKTAFFKGQVIDLEALTEGNSATPEDRQQLMEFFKLYYQSKANNDVMAGIKVLLAMQIYGEKLNPVLNELFGRLPLSQDYDESFTQWEHITDFNHHKILLVGNRFLQLGGRNVENSYHMKLNAMTDKYIFMDTDMAVYLSAGGESVAQAFDRNWNFNAMAATLGEIQKSMPNEMVANLEALKDALEKCETPKYKTVTDRKNFEKCLTKTFYSHPEYKNGVARRQKIATQISEGLQAYNSRYAPTKTYTDSWKSGSLYNDELSSQDTSAVLMTYIENLHFNKNKSDKDRQRTFGSTLGQESESGKYIHHLWHQALENTCLTAAREGRPQRVILHSAYFLPSSGLLRSFAKMIDGTWDCRNVRVTFLTNSQDTTDLNVINFAGKYQMAALFQVYNSRREIFGSMSAARAATFEYYEYLKEGEDPGLSLHTKASIFGDDVIVGSANADVRSYYMDSNNGLFLRGAGDFVKSYSAYVDRLLADKKRTKNRTAYFGNMALTPEVLFAGDRADLENLMQRYNFTKDLSSDTKQMIFKEIYNVVSYIQDTTRKIVAKPYVVGTGEDQQEINRAKEKIQIDLEKKLDRLLQLL